MSNFIWPQSPARLDELNARDAAQVSPAEQGEAVFMTVELMANLAKASTEDPEGFERFLRTRFNDNPRLGPVIDQLKETLAIFHSGAQEWDMEQLKTNLLANFQRNVM